MTGLGIKLKQNVLIHLSMTMMM